MKVKMSLIKFRLEAFLLITFQIYCLSTDCGPLNVANGLFSGTTVYDGSPLITCSTGYDKVGTAKCEANGVWTRPTCDPKGE